MATSNVNQIFQVFHAPKKISRAHSECSITNIWAPSNPPRDLNTDRHLTLGPSQFLLRSRLSNPSPRPIVQCSAYDITYTIPWGRSSMPLPWSTSFLVQAIAAISGYRRTWCANGVRRPGGTLCHIVSWRHAKLICGGDISCHYSCQKAWKRNFVLPVLHCRGAIKPVSSMMINCCSPFFDTVCSHQTYSRRLVIATRKLRCQYLTLIRD